MTTFLFPLRFLQVGGLGCTLIYILFNSQSMLPLILQILEISATRVEKFASPLFYSTDLYFAVVIKKSLAKLVIVFGWHSTPPSKGTSWYHYQWHTSTKALSRSAFDFINVSNIQTRPSFLNASFELMNAADSGAYQNHVSARNLLFICLLSTSTSFGKPTSNATRIVTGSREGLRIGNPPFSMPSGWKNMI